MVVRCGLLKESYRALFGTRPYDKWTAISKIHRVGQPTFQQLTSQKSLETQILGSGMPDLGLQDAKFGIRDATFWLRDLNFGFRESKFELRGTKDGLREPTILHPGTQILIPGSPN